MLFNQPTNIPMSKQSITYRSAKRKMSVNKINPICKKKSYPLPYRPKNNNTSKKKSFMRQWFIYHSINYKHFGGYKKYVFIHKILISSVL